MWTLSIQCTRFKSNYSICTGRSIEIYIWSRKDRMKLHLSPKLMDKLVWVPVISFSRIFIPSSVFDGLLSRNRLFSPPNCETLQRSLLCMNCNPSKSFKVSLPLCKQNSIETQIYSLTFGVSLPPSKWNLKHKFTRFWGFTLCWNGMGI
jgi:hypothetical protein